MSTVERVETTTGPVGVDGRTLTLVSRTRAIRVGEAGRSWVHVRSRPAHVEVLDGDGRRSIVRIHDVQRLATATIVVGAAACVAIVRGRRRGTR